MNFAGYSFPAREECCSRDILLDWKENRGFEKILNAYIHETGHSLARLLSEKSGGEAPVGFIEAILRNPQAPSGYSIRGDLTSLRNRNEIQFEERFAEAFSIYIATRYGQSGRGFDNYVEILEPHFAFFDQVIRELQQNPLERTPITYFRERF